MFLAKRRATQQQSHIHAFGQTAALYSLAVKTALCVSGRCLQVEFLSSFLALILLRVVAPIEN